MQRFIGVLSGVVLLGCLVAAAAPERAQRASAIAFRYLPGGGDLSSDVVTTGVETGPFLDVREMIARGPGSWGMEAPESAEFSAPQSTIRSVAVAGESQALGPMLTLEAWVRAQSDGMSALLVTNRIGDGPGVSIGLDAGVPYVELAAPGEHHRLDAPDDGRFEAGASENAWIAATVSRVGDNLTMSLYLNGRIAAESTTATSLTGAYTIGKPVFVGTRATGDETSPTVTGEFTGHIFAAVLRGYVVNALYANSPMPDDGGAYFGLPDYHDYEPEETTFPMDLRIDIEKVDIEDRFFIPYANDEYIPQGTAFSETVEDDETKHLVYLSYYHRLRSGTIETQRSIVTEIDALTGTVRRTFRLHGQLGYSHAGGVSVSHGAFFISSGGVLERYPIPEWEGPEGPRYYDLEADPEGTIQTPAKASFVSVYEDTLWVGDWRPASDVRPFLFAHALGPDGRPETSASYKFAIPRNIQGVDLFEHDGVRYIFMARNRNSSEAELLRFRLSDLDPDVVVEPDSVITMPHGIEDLGFSPDGALWTNSESGTDYYQRKTFSPWTSFYPFVYSVPKHALFPNVEATGREAPALPDHGSGPQLDVYPNPAAGSTTLDLSLERSGHVLVFVSDLLGRRVETLMDRPAAAGPIRLRWAPDDVAGMFFAVVETGGRRTVRPIVRVP